MPTTASSVEEELERFAREMEQTEKKRKRARKIAEARGRIIVMLIGLARYEPRYETVKALLEDEWRG